MVEGISAWQQSQDSDNGESLEGNWAVRLMSANKYEWGNNLPFLISWSWNSYQASGPKECEEHKFNAGKPGQSRRARCTEH